MGIHVLKPIHDSNRSASPNTGVSLELPEQRKKLQKKFQTRSHLCIRMLPKKRSSRQDFEQSDTCEVGMVRLMYQKMRSIRKAKVCSDEPKRNRFSKLVHDVLHSIRVCSRARLFVDLAVDSAANSCDTHAFQGVRSKSTESEENRLAWDKLLHSVDSRNTWASATPTKRMPGYADLETPTGLSRGYSSSVIHQPRLLGRSNSSSFLKKMFSSSTITKADQQSAISRQSSTNLFNCCTAREKAL